MGLLDQVLGGAVPAPQTGRRGMSPMMMALLALLAYRTLQSRGGLGGMLGGNAAPAPGTNPGLNPGASPNGGGLGGLLKGALGGLLAGGAAGSLLNGGIGDLLKQFQQNGMGDVANSWIGTGPNKSISPQQLEEALGPDAVNSLAEQAGMPREQILSGLSQGLPGLVDQLTPQGRVPSEDEAARWV